MAPAARTLPPVVRLPKVIAGAGFSALRPVLLRELTRRHGPTFTVNLPVWGHTVLVGDPALVRQVFTANTDDLVNIKPNLSRMMGPGCVFALDRDEHRSRRKLLTPPFHGKSIKNYERIIEEETLREATGWPVGVEFPTLDPMMRITLNVILRAVFGADGAELDRLREILPPWVTLGSKLVGLPKPTGVLKRVGPWAKFAATRREFDAIVGSLIARAEADPHLEDRADIFALMLRSRYDDGSAMSHQDIADELVALLTAGHETTASTLAWAFERLRRHPDLVTALVEEADCGGDELRQATILEVQRARTVIDFAGRHVAAPSFELGEYLVPQGYSIMISIRQLHSNADAFPDPQRFDPYRFVGSRPPTFAWVPFGGGTRRCVGAAFANTEMDVVLRTVLQHFTFDSTTEPGERVHSRGVAFTPKRGGRIVLYRR
jgi:cytochrome P450